MMYSVSPKIAQKLKPVNESCVDNGIEMKVVAAEIQDNKATVLVTMRDTEGSRLDETTDLLIVTASIRHMTNQQDAVSQNMIPIRILQPF